MGLYADLQTKLQELQERIMPLTSYLDSIVSKWWYWWFNCMGDDDDDGINGLYCYRIIIMSCVFITMSDPVMHY